MKRIIYTDETGNACVIIPSGKVEAAIKDVPKGKTYKIVNTSDVPSDRYFRNAWKISGSAISIDMIKAREIKKDKLREERKPKLEKLDIEYMRALESGDSAECISIAKKKQSLRDVTIDPAISAAKTASDLKKFRPIIFDEVI